VGGGQVIPLTLAQIAEITGGELRGDPAAVVRGDVVIDSRRAAPGGMFAAVAGERADGHDFAPAAVAAGAVAVLATRPVGVPSVLVDDVPAALAALARFVAGSLPAAQVAGITGSSGKTSTKDLAAQLVERLGPTIAPAGSYNNEFGLPLTVLRADQATRYLVLELSARGAGHIAYLCHIAPPTYGVVLNVGRAHAGEFGGLDQVARAKGELVEALPADGVAILNADDPRVAAMAARTAARVVAFGDSGEVRAADVRLDDLGRPRFTLITAEKSAPVTLRLHGAHHVPNALAAAALARELGLDTDGIADGLSGAEARSRWRMEVHRRADGVTVVNDAYNANPESTRAALLAVEHLTRDGRAFAVLGHMAELGESSRACHEEVGEFAARAVGSRLAALIAVGDEAAPYLAGARRARSWRGEALGVPDAPAALAVLGDRLKPGDVVLVKASRAIGLEAVASALLAGGDDPPYPPRGGMSGEANHQ
jgi:UDP-N-acetylmuramoyl-tripeptide--D-alanyl-D-alanine ligase